MTETKRNERVYAIIDQIVELRVISGISGTFLLASEWSANQQQ